MAGRTEGKRGPVHFLPLVTITRQCCAILGYLGKRKKKERAEKPAGPHNKAAIKIHVYFV